MAKVISLLQPWAELVVIGAKEIETRSWKTEYRGELLIHASKKIDAEAYNICSKEPFNQFIKSPLMLDRGAIIGKVYLGGIEKSEELTAAFNNTLLNGTSEEITRVMHEKAFGDYSARRYGWNLSDPVKFAKPIPCSGHLGLWNFEMPKDWYPELVNQKERKPSQKHSLYSEQAEAQHRIQRDLK